MGRVADAGGDRRQRDGGGDDARHRLGDRRGGVRPVHPGADDRVDRHRRHAAQPELRHVPGAAEGRAAGPA
ncbi:hypothetical protein ACFSTC_59775 [Nonomuraea ferruginea]